MSVTGLVDSPCFVVFLFLTSMIASVMTVAARSSTASGNVIDRISVVLLVLSGGKAKGESGSLSKHTTEVSEDDTRHCLHPFIPFRGPEIVELSQRMQPWTELVQKYPGAQRLHPLGDESSQERQPGAH